jgi:homoserine dehydrogenase
MVRRIPVVVFGAGGVGRALLSQIVAARAVVAERVQARFDIVALADSGRWLWQGEGLGDDRLQEAVAAKLAGKPLGGERPGALEVLDEVERLGRQAAIMVDLTASDDMEPVLDRALALGYGVVLANKKALAGPWRSASRFYHQPRLRLESTVGGGQPVIATLRYLLDTNDPIDRIEGQLSGTLGYICGRLDQGASFSEALREARDRGYTEPDPREDLGGQDVRRKIMILARLAGWPLEEGDIEVEALFHPALAHLPVEEFMSAAVAMDPPMAERVAEAAANGDVLRYTAVVENGRGSVGLTPLSATSPLAHLKYIGFRTGYYADQPMMVGGRGAGVDMTAAGVLGDMVGLVRERLV